MNNPVVIHLSKTDIELAQLLERYKRENHHRSTSAAARAVLKAYLDKYSFLSKE